LCGIILKSELAVKHVLHIRRVDALLLECRVSEDSGRWIRELFGNNNGLGEFSRKDKMVEPSWWEA
jgi:hypothetical protein